MTDTGRRNFVQATLGDYLLETTSDLGDEGEEEFVDTCSSFSLQQCIDEFRSRRIRRSSVHAGEQRDEPQQQKQQTNSPVKADAVNDDELISQNRSNKEHERKCKPCKNGFCYCFTSDSGDGGCGGIAPISANVARGASNSFRNTRRSRKSESGQVSTNVTQPIMTTQRVRERKSAPASLKPVSSLASDTNTLKQHTTNKLGFQQGGISKRPLTAVSRLETTTNDAPLIHIVQELRDNCVISEVRVNKHKLQAKKELSASQAYLKKSPKSAEKNNKCQFSPTQCVEAEVSPKTIETRTVSSIPVARLEISSKNPRKKPGAGRLLQKRLSHSNIQYKPRDFNEPPPKPPRTRPCSQTTDQRSSDSSSTSPSLREAERVVKEFLISKGVNYPKPQTESKTSDKQLKKRMSFPLARAEEQMQIPTCPSLSDLEPSNDPKMSQKEYNQNVKKQPEQSVKDISFGWKEPRVSEMLNYDTNSNRKEFKSQAAQAEPQSIGWQIPPKLSLDTVDGAVRHNLASNLATKNTPVKHQFNGKSSKPAANYKFGWSWAAAPKCPRSFLKQSRKKILKLVTPKKDNRDRSKFQARKTPYRNVAIQTSLSDFVRAEEDCEQAHLSPPGSYHSAVVQTSNDITPQYSTTTNSQNNNNTSDSVQFDFTRKVSSPPRKSTTGQRSSQRKLDFPSNICSASTGFCLNQASTADSAPSFGSVHLQTAGSRTYRSYQTDLDQDVTLSKMGFLLSNIRARLEASDEHAVRTFEEIEQRENWEQHLNGFDCPDSLGIRCRTNIVVDVHANHTNPNRRSEQYEPIYSEIEEESMHVREGPEFDSKTGIESSSSVDAAAIPTTTIDFDALYAKVNKPITKKVVQPDRGYSSSSYKPLGQFLQDSLRKNHTQGQNEQRLSTVTEPSVSDDVSYSSPPIEETSSQQSICDTPLPSPPSHYQSLNNVRVQEQHSPPKRPRNLSKSDLSLHRSEIFHENLCRSELIVEHGAFERLEKVDNQNHNNVNNAALDIDAISYDIPNELPNESIATTTPMQRPQTFLTKLTEDYKNFDHKRATLPIRSDEIQQFTFNGSQAPLSNSCPVTPQKCYNTKTANSNELTASNSQPNSLNESNFYITQSTTEPGSTSTRYKRLKQALQKSFRKSKNFVKHRRPSLPTPLATPLPTSVAAATATTNITETTIMKSATPPPLAQPAQMATSCLNLDELFQLDEVASVSEQIARAVNICRQLPELETSREMVEAERLLLYSTLKREICKLKTNVIDKTKVASQERHLSIQKMRLPVVLEANLTGFFNYYFTITFECDGQIHSTESTEYRHGEVIFHNCNFEFKLQKPLSNDEEPCINCHIFLLRLRKISTSTPAGNADVNDVLLPNDITPLPSTPSSAVSLDGIMSRFRLYGSFRLDASSFKPYNLNSNNSSYSNENSNQLISLSAFNNCRIPLKLCSTLPQTLADTAAKASIVVTGNSEAYFEQHTFSGFLHVQDPYTLHNWNWRWCTLRGLQLQIWTDNAMLSTTPLMTLSLADQAQTLPLQACDPELCARVRSFCIQCSTLKIDAEVATAAVFFAADSDADLKQWLKNLNQVFDFIVEWMQ